MISGLGAFASGLSGGINAAEERKERRAMADALGVALGSTAATGTTDDLQAHRRDRTPRGAPRPVSVSRPASAPSPMPSARDPSLFALIDQTEGAGDYATLFGHSQRDGGRFAGTDVSRMSIREALDFASPRGDYGRWVRRQVGRVATPMGRHQIVGSTLRSAAAEMGLPLDTPFDAATQDAIATHLARRRLAAADTPAERRAALRAEWEGFRNVDDAALDAAIAEFMGRTA